MKRLYMCIRRDAGLSAMALLAGAVVVIETGLGLWGPESTLIKEYRQVITRAMREPAPDLLIMGDSVARGSILAGVVAEQLGQELSARNDAMQGTGPEVAYFTLKRELATGKVPKAVLYAPSPHTFASTRMHIAAGGFCTWPEVLDLLRSGHDRIDILGSTLLRFSYTLRYREQLAMLLKGRREIKASFRDPVIDERAWIDFYERELAQRKPVDFSRLEVRAKYLAPFTVAPVNRHYLERFLELAGRHGIQVYWAIPPVMQRTYEGREAVGFNTDYSRFLEGLAARYRVALLQHEFPVYPEACFYDQNHFDIPASQRFSAELGQRLRAAWQVAATGPMGPPKRDGTPGS